MPNQDAAQAAAAVIVGDLLSDHSAAESVDIAARYKAADDDVAIAKLAMGHLRPYQVRRAAERAAGPPSLRMQAVEPAQTTAAPSTETKQKPVDRTEALRAKWRAQLEGLSPEDRATLSSVMDDVYTESFAFDGESEEVEESIPEYQTNPWNDYVELVDSQVAERSEESEA